jgi:hypothetical protein
VSILPISLLDPDAEQYVAEVNRITVSPANNTVVRHIVNLRTGMTKRTYAEEQTRVDIPAGACSNWEKGFRPWKRDDGTTLGY